MNTEQLVVAILQGLIEAGIAIYEGVTGERMSEEEFREEMRRMLLNPPRKADIGDWGVEEDDVP